MAFSLIDPKASEIMRRVMGALEALFTAVIDFRIGSAHSLAIREGVLWRLRARVQLPLWSLSRWLIRPTRSQAS